MTTQTTTTAAADIESHTYSRHSRRPWECRICKRCPHAHATHEHPSDLSMCEECHGA